MGLPSLCLRELLRQDGKRLIRMINNKEIKEHEFEFIVNAWNKNEGKDDNKVVKLYKSIRNCVKTDGFDVELSFCGNYEEPKLCLNLNEYLDEFAECEGQIVLKMMMNPSTKEWIVPNKKEQAEDKNVKSLWFVNGDNEEEKKEDE